MNFPTITVELSKKFKEIEIIGIGDVHYGSPEHNAELFDEVINRIKTQENLYCILLGDLIECVTKDSVGDLYTQIGTPQDQADYIVEKLKPISHKIIAMTGGNHENRIFKTCAFDISYSIAKDLGITDRYVKNSFVLFVTFGKVKGQHNKPHSWSIFITHGVGGSTKKPSKLKKLIELKDLVAGCDVYIMGHVHDFICTYDDTYIVDLERDKINSKVSVFISQGAFLDFGGYGYEKLYKPLSKKHGTIIMGYSTQTKKSDEKYLYIKG